MENEVKISITGLISDFSRIDNVYLSMKRECEKIFSKWNFDISIEYHEKAE